MYSTKLVSLRAAAAPLRQDFLSDRPHTSLRLTARKIDILAAEIGFGQRHAGVAKGPRVLLDRGLAPALRRAGHDVCSVRTVSEAAAADRGAMLSTLADQIETTLKAGRFALTLGGDHALAFASIEGVLRACPSARILYIDAHADANTPGSSPSGNTHGMPLAAHLGLFDPAEVAEAACVGARLDPAQIAFIGLRDVDEGEARFLKELGIAQFSSEDVHTQGADAILRQALQTLDPVGEHPLFVSFDIDVIDPEIVPATGVPAPGGLEIDEVNELTRGIARTGRLIGLDLVEVNPDLAPDEESLVRTVEIAISVITSMMA